MHPPNAAGRFTGQTGNAGCGNQAGLQFHQIVMPIHGDHSDVFWYVCTCTLAVPALSLAHASSQSGPLPPTIGAKPQAKTEGNHVASLEPNLGGLMPAGPGMPASDGAGRKGLCSPTLALGLFTGDASSLA